MQDRMGVDVVMPLDECPPAHATPRVVEEAVARTVDWARRSRAEALPPDRHLFGIVQGGVDAGLRRRCAAQLAELEFPGYAVGGLSVGEDRVATQAAAAVTAEALPRERPRYLMGVGFPEDLLRFVSMGYDMCDCVLPTRNGRNGMLFTSRGRLNIRLARHARDSSPPDPDCACAVCGRFSRAYLRHLAVSGEMLGAQLATAHNLHYYLHLMAEARRRIEAGEFAGWARAAIETMEEETPA